MSVEQIEQEIQQLPARDLLKLTEWFSRFLASKTPTAATAEAEWQETPELIAELDRRLADFAANPAIAAPFEPDYFEKLKRRLADERAEKASAR